MDKDLKFYNEYLNGDEKAFNELYNKYKNKIQYFIFNIVKDYEKAEDITQEVFIYAFQNPKKTDCSFKYYIYLIAKSKAFSFIKQEKRREQIKETYFSNNEDMVEKDIIEVVAKEETKKELIEAINMLDDKYKNAIYLVKIEELSYKEASEILGESISNLKNLIHRGKRELRKILIKKGFGEMKNVSKTVAIILCMVVLLSGIAYATYKIYESLKTGNAKITPTFTSKLSNTDTNKVWVGTFNLVWNDFMNDVIKGPIEFEDGESELAKELNKQAFTKNELSEESYYKIQGESTFDLKEKIEKDIKEKFNEESTILDKVDWGNPNSYTLYCMLKKEFNYLERFPSLNSASFNDSQEKVKYFGLDSATIYDASKNVEVLFYNSKEDFAIKLKTKEGEEVILYKTTGNEKSFEENYKEVLEKQKNYTGSKVLKEEVDSLKIPFIKLSSEINYDELCGRMIKNSNYYIRQALQTVDFELNNYGGSVKSEALIEGLQKGIREKVKEFHFDSDFILYLKEENKDKPYFALKVDNTDVLVLDGDEY